MTNAKHEDAVMKMGFDYFRNTILKTLGIDYQYEEIGPTELVELTIQSLYMDFTFLTTGDFYIHTEFQTTDKKEADLRRFHAYDAVYSNKTGKKVITYVIYSGGITNVKSELDCGLYTYRVQPIYLKDKNADEVFRKLKQKQDNGEAFTEDDYAALSLTPLMSGKMSHVSLTHSSESSLSYRTFQAILKQYLLYFSSVACMAFSDLSKYRLIITVSSTFFTSRFFYFVFIR